MKTKITFEEKDFNGCGQVIVSGDFPSITTAYKVGYGYFFDRRFYFLVSLADGMTCYHYEFLNDFVEAINKDGKFRPMTKKEIIEVVGEQGNRFPAVKS